MNIDMNEVILIAVLISVILKFLYSLEDFFVARSWLSVKIENQIGPISVKIKDMNEQEVLLSFTTLADYHKWIKNHIKAANKIPELYEKAPEDSTEE